MIRLDRALRAWGTPDFKAVLKQEIARLGHDQLPLQHGLSYGSHVTAEPISVMINSITETDRVIRVTAGIFFQGVMSGCSCADDPTPTSPSNEYCEVRLDIDKMTAAIDVALLS